MMERLSTIHGSRVVSIFGAAGPALDAIAENGGARAGDALELRLLAWPRAEARDWLRARFARRGVDAKGGLFDRHGYSVSTRAETSSQYTLTASPMPASGRE